MAGVWIHLLLLVVLLLAGACLPGLCQHLLGLLLLGSDRVSSRSRVGCVVAVDQSTRACVVKVVLTFNQTCTVDAHQVNGGQVIDVLAFAHLRLLAFLLLRVLQLLHQTAVLALSLLH